jgi:hypothetical protein
METNNLAVEIAPQTGNQRKLFLGAVFILISNLIYIGNNYLVAWTGLLAPEIALFRGVLQCLVFGSIVFRSWKNSKGKLLH